MVLVILNVFSYWQINGESGTFSMAPALPPCTGEVLAEGFTYLFRNPHRGEIVMFRARGSVGGEIVPTAHRWNLQINKRVIGLPGDTVEGKRGRVYVDGRPADNIRTAPFAAVHLGHDQLFRDGRQPHRFHGQPRLRPSSAQRHLCTRRPQRLASRPRWCPAVRQEREATRAPLRTHVARWNVTHRRWSSRQKLRPAWRCVTGLSESAVSRAPARASSGPAPAIASLPRGPQAESSAGGAAGGRALRRIRSTDHRIEKKRDKLLLLGGQRRHLDQTLPRSPHTPSKAGDGHRHTRSDCATERRRRRARPSDAEGTPPALTLREVLPELGDVVPEPTSLVLPLFQRSLLVRSNRDSGDGSQTGHFSCGAVRSPAQAFSLHRTASRTPSPVSY
jgi:signal peptidase I